MVTLHSEINKQDSQLYLRTHKSKLFSTFVLVKRKNDPGNICESFPIPLVLVGSLAGIATHVAHLPWSHRTGFEQIHLLMAVLSELFKLFLSEKYHVYVTQMTIKKDVLIKVI